MGANFCVVVLTIGWTGSSVLTGLLARAGMSTGDATMKKPDYDTFENLELTELNKRLVRESGCSIDYTRQFSWRALATVASATERIDTSPYRHFIQRLDSQRPWVWKDPRLWLTIRFWHQIADFSTVKFVWLTRDNLQSWISANIRRQIISYEHCRWYNAAVNGSIEAFLEMNELPFVNVSFDDLILLPDKTLDRLNTFLGLRLTLNDLQSSYGKPLRKPARGFRDLLLASAIHGKNYFQRIDEKTKSSMSLPPH